MNGDLQFWPKSVMVRGIQGIGNVSVIWRSRSPAGEGSGSNRPVQGQDRRWYSFRLRQTPPLVGFFLASTTVLR